MLEFVVMTAREGGRATPNQEDIQAKSGLARFGGNFDLLDQGGHFRIPDSPFTHDQRVAWLSSLTTGEQLEFNTITSQILEWFGVDNLASIKRVLADHHRLEERTVEANRIIAKRFGIGGSDDFVKAKLEDYYQTAVREREDEASQLGKVRAFGLTNKVSTTSNILKLVGLALFDESKKVRFEAEKILDGMESAANMDRIRREEETARYIAGPHIVPANEQEGEDEDKDPDIEAINKILEENFYSAAPKDDATLLLSKHDDSEKGDFRVLDIKEIPPKQARYARFRRAPLGHLYTELPERTVRHDGTDTPAYVHVRRKPVESTIRKGRRKGTKNIRKAVEDNIGMKIVVPKVEDIPQVHNRLVQAFTVAGYSFSILEQEDSLTGGPYSAKNAGSSPKLRVINMIAEIGPWLAEIQYYDRAALIDSTAQDGVSRKEFELNRLYSSGVPQHDFPEHIFGQPHEQIRKSRVREIRDGIRIGLFRDEHS